MPSEVVFNGLNELREEFKAFPGGLEAWAAQQVHDIAEDTWKKIYNAYVVKSGDLQRSLQPVSYSANGLKAKIKNTAIYAGAYESGSKPRTTKKNKNRGFVKAHDNMVPAVMRARRTLRDNAARYLDEHHYQISGIEAA